MSHDKLNKKKQIFFIPVQPRHDLERAATSKPFPLLIEITVSTLKVDGKHFLCDVPSTETLLAWFHVVWRQRWRYVSPPLVWMQLYRLR